MEASELELYSSDELIAELMRRRTFLGVIVHSLDDVKNEQWGEERMFKVHFNQNLCATKASRLLDRVAAYMELELPEPE